MKYKVVIPNFITHIAKTNNKKSPNKYIKINNQLIYNSNLNRFARNIVVNNLHEYLIHHISLNKIPQLGKGPYQISLDIYAPINYGDVSRRKLKDIGWTICWNEPIENYVPTWDIGNLGELWMKTFEDSLQLSGVLENDSVAIIKSHGPITFYEVKTLDERKLIFNINKLK
jgi:hypothetical protein